MSGQRRIIENGAIAVRGERIVAVGTRAEIDRAGSPRAASTAPTACSRPA
jgi:imidazolonepropionase-like amidohydrolase